MIHRSNSHLRSMFFGIAVVLLQLIIMTPANCVEVGEFDPRKASDRDNKYNEYAQRTFAMTQDCIMDGGDIADDGTRAFSSITIDTIKMIHNMVGFDLNDNDRGVFKTKENGCGPYTMPIGDLAAWRARYPLLEWQEGSRSGGVTKGAVVFAQPAQVVLLMNNLIQKIQQGPGPMSRDEWARNIVREFLHIHPFLDGNGRTARILYKVLMGQRSSDLDDVVQMKGGGLQQGPGLDAPPGTSGNPAGVPSCCGGNTMSRSFRRASTAAQTGARVGASWLIDGFDEAMQARETLMLIGGGSAVAGVNMLPYMGVGGMAASGVAVVGTGAISFGVGYGIGQYTTGPLAGWVTGNVMDWWYDN